MGHFLCGVERVQPFTNIHLQCIVSNLRKINKMTMLTPPEKISADAHARRPFFARSLLERCHAVTAHQIRQHDFTINFRFSPVFESADQRNDLLTMQRWK